MSDLYINDAPDDKPLFDRIVSILEQARDNVVQAVNSNMVMAYWLVSPYFSSIMLPAAIDLPAVSCSLT